MIKSLHILYVFVSQSQLMKLLTVERASLMIADIANVTLAFQTSRIDLRTIWTICNVISSLIKIKYNFRQAIFLVMTNTAMQ